jgi:hypothetical protein
MNEVQVKEIVRGIVRESFKQSLSEATYAFGKKSYTDKHITPEEILDLANAYLKEPITKLAGNSLGHRVYVANDFARLTGTIQMDVRTRSKQPALIVQLLKNKLLTRDEYVKLYQELIKKQAHYIEKYLQNASPEKRRDAAAAKAAAIDGKDEFFRENVNEMSVNDVHFKNILRAYDHGGSFTKKKVATAVCKNPNASRNKVIDYLKDMDYEEILQVEDELRIGESVEGDRIQKLNDRIRVLRAKISAQKDAVKRNELQQTLKNALQSLSNVRKNHGIKTESVVAKDGKVLSNNNLIGYYEFDRDADSFWVDDVKKGKGQLSFDTKKEVEDYFKKNEKDALKHLGKLRGESVNELKTLSNGNFKIKKQYNTFADYEKHAKIGDTILKYDKKSSMKDMISNDELHQNAKRYLNKVHSIGTDGVNVTIFGKQTPASIHPSDKKELAVVVLESTINEAKFPIYHNSYTSAIDSALDWANKSGFDYDKEETAQKIGLGPKKPSDGKTNRFSIELSKGGKEQRKQLHIQVYGMGNGKYELNAYIG